MSQVDPTYWVHEDPRLSNERKALQSDYLARRAAMYKLAVIQGAIVVLCLLAMFIGIIALYSSIGALTPEHKCTVALLVKIQNHQTGVPSACKGQLP